MIFIITGEIGSGKTARLSELFIDKKNMDGYLLVKAYEANQYIGQNILWLSNNSSLPFSRLCDRLPVDWEEQERYRDYSFSRQGLELMTAIYESLLENAAQIAFIDDIGPLELMGGGAAEMFAKLIKTTKDVFVTIRRDCLYNTLDYFSIIKDKHMII